MKADRLNTNEKWCSYLKCIVGDVEGGLDMQKLEHFRKAPKIVITPLKELRACH